MSLFYKPILIRTKSHSQYSSILVCLSMMKTNLQDDLKNHKLFVLGLSPVYRSEIVVLDLLYCVNLLYLFLYRMGRRRHGPVCVMPSFSWTVWAVSENWSTSERAWRHY